MGRILAISSQVVRGHVGLSAIVPALQRLGHDVLPVPTIILSNHPGHVRAAGTRIEINTLLSMIEVLDANGWLGDIDAIMTGYMPTPEHVDFACRVIDLVRKRHAPALVLVDPVIGDDPRGLYVELPVAEAIRRDLLGRATLITPNRFELSWLARCDVTSVASAVTAAAALGRADLGVLATSVPDGDGRLANVSAGADGVMSCSVDRVAKAPHGTGDLLTGLYVGHGLRRGFNGALGLAVGGVKQAIINSAGRSDLLLAVGATSVDWVAAPAVETTPWSA